ncbi:phosphatidic acid phosphatase [Spirochaetia bacterium]|nr:phosphatidic acid phosphatase [Spirochaetia bacterium]
MEAILLWGLDLIRAVQTIANPSLTAFMKALTNLGAASAYMVLLPLIFWCFDEKKGIRLGLAIMFSTWINLGLKFALHQPRPFWDAWDPKVGMVKESSNGFPSGHAQASLVIWAIVASWGKKKYFYVAAILLSLLVGFSRIYLGVHFPTDLFGGWILGALVLAAYFLFADKLEAALVKGGFRVRIYAAATAAFIMILYRPSPDLLIPGAVVLGMGIGYSLTCRYLHFSAAPCFGRRGAAKFCTLLVRFMLGIIGVVLVFLVLGKIEPENDSSYYQLFFFLRFVILALWIFTGAPWLFQRLHLAETPAPAAVMQE